SARAGATGSAVDTGGGVCAGAGSTGAGASGCGVGGGGVCVAQATSASGSAQTRARLTRRRIVIWTRLALVRGRQNRVSATGRPRVSLHCQSGQLPGRVQPDAGQCPCTGRCARTAITTPSPASNDTAEVPP